MSFNFIASLLLLMFVATTASPYQSFKQPRALPSDVQVTSFDQLWRYHVGPGDDGISIGDRFIAILTSGMKFVRNSYSEWVFGDGDDCLEEHRFELHDLGNGKFAIKNAKYQQWWSCRDNGQLWGVGSLSTWEYFKLYVDANEDNLVIRSYNWPDYNVYLWTDTYLYCDDYSGYYQGRNQFPGWKGQDEEWLASDKYVTVVEVDNREGSSPIKKEIEYSTGVTESQAMSRAGSLSTSTTAAASFREIFSTEIQSSIGFDWSNSDVRAFSENFTDKTTVEVQPGSRFRVLEAIGKYGPLQIDSGSLKYVQDLAGENGEENEMFDEEIKEANKVYLAT